MATLVHTKRGRNCCFFWGVEDGGKESVASTTHSVVDSRSCSCPFPPAGVGGGGECLCLHGAFSSTSSLWACVCVCACQPEPPSFLLLPLLNPHLYAQCGVTDPLSSSSNFHTHTKKELGGHLFCRCECTKGCATPHCMQYMYAHVCVSVYDPALQMGVGPLSQDFVQNFRIFFQPKFPSKKKSLGEKKIYLTLINSKESL